MSACNVQTTLSGISVPNPIVSLVMYSQGTLPVYLFMGDNAGKLYIYDMSYGTQNSFSVSGTAMNNAFTGLAVTDQYLFANTPGNCYQIPLYQFYGTTSTVINTLSAVSVANCYTRDSTNTHGIAVTPGGESLFLVTGLSTITKVSISDTGNGAAKDFAKVIRYLDPELSGLAIDSVGKTLYATDIRSRRIFTVDYSVKDAIISNIYIQIPTNDIPYEIEYSAYTGEIAYVTTNLNNDSALKTYNPLTAFFYDIIPLNSPNKLKLSYAMTYDTVGNIYVSCFSNNAYTVIQNSYFYVERPQPSVAPPKQKSVECGLILPGSCKQTWHPFNPRERFSLGSPNRPYQKIDLSAKISCPPSFVSDACPGFSQGGEIAQVDEVPGGFPRTNHQGSALLEVHIGGPFHQVQGHPRGDPTHRAHRGRQDHHPLGAKTPAGDTHRLVTPAMATQIAPCHPCAFPPKGFLGSRFEGYPDAELGLPHTNGSLGGHHFHGFTGLQQQLERPLGQGLGRGPRDG